MDRAFAKNRALEMAEQRKKHPLWYIGQLHGVSAERVRQILIKYNLTQNNNCIHLAAEFERRRKELDRIKARNENAIRMYGSDLEAIKKLPQDKATKIKRMYRQQKRWAKRGGHECKININEYWSVWAKSRKFNQKGQTKSSYCLSRIDFNKDITIENLIVEKRSDYAIRLGRYASTFHR